MIKYKNRKVIFKIYNSLTITCIFDIFLTLLKNNGLSSSNSCLLKSNLILCVFKSISILLAKASLIIILNIY